MDSRIKWLFFGLAFAISAIEFGLAFSFGALLPVILETFHTDRTTAAVVQSLLIGVSTCFGVISGILINKFGLHIVTLLSSVFVSSGFAVSYFITDIRYLYASISILAGVGLSMIFVSSVTLISTIFSGKQRSFCIAIHGTCTPVAGMFYPYLLDVLVSTYGLSGTFLVLGAIFCNTFVFSLILWIRRGELTPDKENVADERKPNYRYSKIHQTSLVTNVVQFLKELMSKRYICFLVANGLAVSAINGYLDFVFDIALWKEYDESHANLFFMIYNVFGIIFSIVPGLLIVDIDTYFYSFLYAVFAFSGSLMVYFSTNYAMYAVGSACFGSMPGMVTSSFIICTKLVKFEQIDVATGTLITVIGILSACIGPIFGTIRDNSGSYGLVFAIMSAAQAIAALLFVMDIIQRRLNGVCTVRNGSLTDNKT